MGHAVATVLDRTGAIGRVVEDCVCDRGLNVMFLFFWDVSASYGRSITG